jgi:hypothetical protein
MRCAVVLFLLVAGPAHAETQVQADLGLAVVGVGVETAVQPHHAVMVEAQIFGTYFLPWFDAGDNLVGFGVQVRPTWFSRVHQHGAYVTPFVRLDRVTDDHDSAAFGFCAGAAVGWAFPLTQRLDMRIGAGAQYMRYKLATSDVSTPFVQLDLVVGYRL